MFRKRVKWKRGGWKNFKDVHGSVGSFSSVDFTVAETAEMAGKRETPRRTSAQVATDRDGQTNIESGGSTTCGLIHLNLPSIPLSLYPFVSFSPRNEGEISLYSFFRPTIDHTRQGDPEFSSKLQLQFLRFLRFFEFRVDRDFNIESPRDILEMEYSGLFRTCINARYIGNKNVWESRIKFFREFKASLSSRCRELRNLFKVQFQEWYTWQ